MKNEETQFGHQVSTRRVEPFWWLIIALGVCIVLLGVFMFWVSDTSPTAAVKTFFSSSEETPEQTQEQTTPPPSVSTVIAESSRNAERIYEDGRYVTLIYFDGESFSPEAAVVESGEAIRFINTTNLTMRVGSRPENLSSTDYSDVDQPTAKGEGGTFEVTFSKPGIWAYENLTSSSPRVFGTVFIR